MNRNETLRQMKYLKLLAKEYPDVQSVATEIINLQAILQLPKGTEHYMSDLHGEYPAFRHLLNNCSGVIKSKIDLLFSKSVPQAERSELATLIYYPEPKLSQQAGRDDYGEWLRITLYRLIDVCRVIAGKYTRSKVRKALPADYAYIIDELLNADYQEHNKEEYYGQIVDTMLSLGRAEGFIQAVSDVIKRLAVDSLHILGDIFDRGGRPDGILDILSSHHCVDIQWGNHDVLWIGAASGSPVCIANVVSNCTQYNNLDVLETAYGINMRPLALFARDAYGDCPAFAPRLDGSERVAPKYLDLLTRMHKAAAIIQFKLEGQAIKRHPELMMDERMLLHRISLDRGTVTVGIKEYPLADRDFPTVDAQNPYTLTRDESEVMDSLCRAFLSSDKLQRHIRFLLQKGSMYLCRNHNLLYHGCVPMTRDGAFAKVRFLDEELSGKALFDYCDAAVRLAYYGGERQRDMQDFVWYLWCGKHSPLFGRSRMTSFERLFVQDEAAWKEEKNPYYTFSQQEACCLQILSQFGLNPEKGHIINGHVPVRRDRGEQPVRAGGRLIMIDGGLCKAYHSKTGIAGYTLIDNSHGLRLAAHQPFHSEERAIRDNEDILSSSEVCETLPQRVKVRDTDNGEEIRRKIQDLQLLIDAYRMGLISPQS